MSKAMKNTEAMPFWTFDDGFDNFTISGQEDVDNWFGKAKQIFDDLVSKYAEKDLGILRAREIEVSKFLRSFQQVRDQFIKLKYECPELIEGVRYSRITGAPQ